MCVSLLVAAASLLPAAATAGQSKKLTAKRSGVVAIVTYQGSSLYAQDVRITLKRAGAMVIRRARVRDSATGQPTSNGPSALAIADLNGDGEPEVILDLNTGGVHCCAYSRIYQFDAAYADYTWTEHEWGNYSYSIGDRNKDGVPEFSTADDRFAYAFTAFSFSVPPLQIFEYRAGEMRDVTSSYPKRVRRDARTWWRMYVKQRRRPAYKRADLRGVLAGWAADKYRLGEQDEVWKTLRGARRRGELRGSAPWPKGRSYLRELRSFLEATGYAD